MSQSEKPPEHRQLSHRSFLLQLCGIASASVSLASAVVVAVVVVAIDGAERSMSAKNMLISELLQFIYLVAC